MKNLYTIIMVAAGLLMLVACMKETIEPEQRISGEFVPSPDNPLDGCFSYVVFQKGYYAVKLSNNFYYFAENKLWNCNERNFSSLAKIPYYISGGELFLEGKSQGAISLKGDILTINGRKYEKLRGFSEKHFFKIVPASTTVTSDYTTHSISVPYTITSEYPATHAELTVSCKESWVENISVSADKITFNVQENNSRTQRNANLDLILPHAETVRVNLTQSYASSSLSFTPSSQSAPYTSGSYSFTYAVTNPRVGVNVTAVSQNNWITDVVVSGNTVSYKVAENNSVVAREGKVRLSYGSYATNYFMVNQSGKPVQSLSLNKNSLVLFLGTSETLVAAVNPTDAPLQWASDNALVATVNQSGVVSAVGNGTATITVSAENGKSASCSVTVYPPTNLSEYGSSNCYIVSSDGTYSFRTSRGNSSISVGGVSSVVVLWESYGTSTAPSVGSIINNVWYRNNTVIFSTPSILKNGNAVIAAKDVSGEILWSWHIWVCEGYVPEGSAQIYYNDAGTMMDRNLGATSATPGDVGALGLLYQWGRKDPFLSGGSISSSTKAKSTLTWPSPVNSTSSNGTIEYAVKNPTTFIKYNSNNYDWYYTGSSSTDNTRWQTSKTIYDPCPPGWKVPTGGSSGVWSKAANTSSSFYYTWDSTNKGTNFYGKFGASGTIWYPTAGYQDGSNGSLYYVGNYGYWWSCTPYSRFAYKLYLDRDGYGYVYPSNYHTRSYGLSVRCQKE